DVATTEILRRQNNQNLVAGAQNSLKLSEELLKQVTGQPVCTQPGHHQHAAEEAGVNAPWDPNDKTTKAPAPCQQVSPTSTTCAQYFTPPNTSLDYTIDF